MAEPTPTQTNKNICSFLVTYNTSTKHQGGQEDNNQNEQKSDKHKDEMEMDNESASEHDNRHHDVNMERTFITGDMLNSGFYRNKCVSIVGEFKFVIPCDIVSKSDNIGEFDNQLIFIIYIISLHLFIFVSIVYRSRAFFDAGDNKFIVQYENGFYWGKSKYIKFDGTVKKEQGDYYKKYKENEYYLEVCNSWEFGNKYNLNLHNQWIELAHHYPKIFWENTYHKRKG